jgi:argininosuccinate lyase
MPNVERTLLILKILNNGYFVRDGRSIADEVKTDKKIVYRKHVDNVQK